MVVLFFNGGGGDMSIWINGVQMVAISPTLMEVVVVVGNKR
jgi:hypothetical protein